MDTKKVMEDIMSVTYPGLTMLYRDVNLGILAADTCFLFFNEANRV